MNNLLKKTITGRATISTRTSGVRDTTRNGETGIIPIGDEDALVKALDLLMRNPEAASTMGRKAKEFILENFIYKNDLDRIVHVWKQAVRH